MLKVIVKSSRKVVVYLVCMMVLIWTCLAGLPQNANADQTLWTYGTGSHPFTAPASGTYRLEVWGSAGNSYWIPYLATVTGGNGGYSCGDVYLTAGQTIYVVVGSKTGSNGGGSGAGSGNNGGGATDIRYSQYDLYSRIVVAGGGGGGASQHDAPFAITGGTGGGLIGGTGNARVDNGTQYGGWGGPIGGQQNQGGTAMSGYNTGYGSQPGSFGYGGSASSGGWGWLGGGGGGGWYGGASGYSGSYTGSIGGGGSGYVLTSTSARPGGYNPPSQYYLSNTQIMGGDMAMPNPYGGAMIGNSGDGYARITLYPPAVGTKWFMSYTGGTQPFTAPCAGSYQLEVWGAQGYGSNYYTSGPYGGKGGYSVGNINLNTNETLYVNIGGSTGYNGGGSGGYNGSGNGGGATDIRRNGNRIIVAGGGGGLYGGGAGGGNTGTSISGGGGGGSQTAGGTGGSGGQNGSPGQGGNGYSGYGGGGGGGYYGGGGGSYTWVSHGDNDTMVGTGGGGGSGYIGGVQNGNTIDGNTSFSSPSGGTETGHSGDGYAIITLLAAAPNPASNLQITGVTTSSISASWSANGNPAGTIYNLVLQNPSNGQWLSNPETTNTSYTFTGLQANTQYNVWVRVRNSSGVWATSDYQLIGQPYTLPNPASNLQITGVTTSSISASWSANGNPSGTIYNLVLQNPSNGQWLQNPEITNTSYTFTGLQANTQYNVWVRVRNSAGTWATPNYQLIGTVYTLANTPSSPSYGTIAQTSMVLNWNTNGNSSSTQYFAAVVPNGANPDVTTNWVANSGWQTNISTWTASGLTAGTQYRAYVKATNGDGTRTSWADFGPKWTLSNMPSNIVGNNGGLAWSNTAGRGWVTLSWPAVTGATGYTVYVWDGNAYRAFDIGNTTSWDSRTAKIYPSETTLSSFADNTQSGDLFNHSMTGLDLRDNPNTLYKKTIGTTYDASTNYWFRVTAYNSSGDSGIDWSQGYFPTLPNRTAATAPGVPTINFTSPVGYTSGSWTNTNISFTITNGTDNGGAGIQKSQYSLDNGKTWTDYTSEVKVSTQGITSILARTIDNVGNISMPGYYFNGVDNNVQIGNLGARPTTGTIEFWMNPSVVENYRDVFSTNGLGYNAAIRFEEHTGGYFEVDIGDNGGSSWQGHIFTNTGLQANTWNHIALVWDSSQNKVWGYLNGVLVINGQSQTIWPTNFNDVRIGVGFDPTRYWKGTINEVSIWNTIRNQSQVQSDMSSCFLGTEQGLLGYWRLKENSGLTAYDSSPNNHNGTIYGATYAGGTGIMKIETTIPTINLTQSPTAATSNPVTITANISGSISGLAVQKWAQGNQTAAYFAAGGTTFTGTFQVNSNDTYTVYVKDNAGNEAVQTITITNISIIPTLNIPTTSGSLYLGEDITVSDTGTNINQAAYRVYYTANVTAPSITNGNDPGTGWVDSGISGPMTISGGTGVSVIVPGASISNNNWTYITFKVWVASSTNDSATQYSQAYVVSSDGNSVLNYVGHNQIIKILQTGKDVIVSDPDTPVQAYNPDPTSVSYLSQNNVFENANPYLRYRLEFDVLKPQIVKDIEIDFDFDLFNETGIEFTPKTMTLEKLNNDGTVAEYLQTYNIDGISYIKQSRNRYILKLGNDVNKNSIIWANGQGRYAVEYTGTLDVQAGYSYSIATVLMRNNAEIFVYTVNKTYPDPLDLRRPSRKSYIDTKVTKANVQYQ